MENQNPSDKNEEIIIETPEQTTAETEIKVPDVPQANQKKAPSTRHRGAFIASIICVVLALAFTIGSYFVIGSFLKDYVNMDDNVQRALGFVLFLLYMFTFGLFTFVPALGTSIASICTSVRCWSSSVKTFKVFGIIIFIVSIILLLALVGILILFMLPNIMSVFQ